MAMAFQTASCADIVLHPEYDNLGSNDLPIIVIVAQSLPQVYGHGARRQRAPASPPLLRSII
jgi:hypothetical protein